MATTQFNNRLITPELTEALSCYPLYSQDAKKKDALCIAVFYLGNIRWYIMEGQPEGDDFTLYGIVAAYDYDEPCDVVILSVRVNRYGKLTIIGDEKNDRGNEHEIEVDDIFCGHLDYLISEIGK